LEEVAETEVALQPGTLGSQRSLDQQLADIDSRLRSLAAKGGDAPSEPRTAGTVELQADLCSRRAALEADRRQFEINQKEWEAQKSEVQRTLENRVAGLDALRVDLESQRAAMDKERRNSEREGSNEELQMGWAKLESERREWELQRSEIEARQRADFDARQQSLVAAQIAWESKLAEDRQAAAARDAELDAIRAELAAQRARLEEQCRQFEVRLASLPSRESEFGDRSASSAAKFAQTVPPAEVPVSELPEIEVPIPEPTVQVDPDQDSAAESPEPSVVKQESVSRSITEPRKITSSAPSNHAPVDLATILRKTGFQVDLDDEEPPTVKKVEGKRQPAKDVLNGAPPDRPADRPTVDISAPVPRPRKAPESNEKEVSVDEYMSRLLARSRGDAEPPSDPKAGPVRTAVSTAPSAVSRPILVPAAPVPASADPPPAEAGEIAPRAVPPEKRIDMRAMRQLANLSAKNALQNHERKQLSGTKRAKLLVTLVSAVVGVLLLIIHLLPKAPPVTIYGAIASFAVATLWGVNYLKLLAEMASEQFAHMSRHLKAAEGAAENTSEAESAKAAGGEAKREEGP
jgi:hypothetical protein